MHRNTIKRRRFIELFVAISPFGFTAWSSATVRTYVGPNTSNWSTAANWSPSGVPVGGSSSTTAGDSVNLTNGGARPASVNITFDANYGLNNPLGQLDIDGTGFVNDTLTIPANTLSIYGNEMVGLNGSGNVIQTGGTASVGVIGTLYLATNANTTGTYTLNNTTSAATLNVAANEYDGYSGSATFTQTNGTHNVNGFFVIAQNNSSTGTYNLTNGALNVGTSGSGSPGTNNEIIGYGGNATFNQLTAGTNTVGSAAVNQNLYLGFGSGSFAVYNLSGSSSIIVNGNENIGESSTGTVTHVVFITQYGATFYQNGGNNQVTGNFTLADNAGSTGSYTLGNGGAATLTVGGNETIGNNGTGSFVQNSGTNTTISDGLSVGYLSSGNYTLNGGTLNAAGTHLNGENIGEGGSGSFTQTGGTNNVGGPLASGNLTIGFESASTGTYVLNSNTGPAVLNATQETVGLQSTGTVDSITGAITSYGGTFIQTSGQNNTVSLDVADESGATGLFNFSGGQLASNFEFIGAGGTGLFMHNAGSNIVSASSYSGLYLGEFGGFGIYDLSGSSAVLTVNGVLEVEDGVFNMSAGSAAISGNVTVGTDGLLLLSGGSLTVGSLSLTDPLSFNWTAGTLHVTTSSFQIPGNLSLANGMTLVTDGGLNIATGVELHVNGGSLTLSAGSTASNQGIFNQSSGSVTVNGAFVNSGTAIFSGNQSWGASSVFVSLAGSATFASKLSPTGFGPAVVVTGGSVNMPATQQLTGLTIGTGALVKSAVAGLDHATITQGLTFAGSYNYWTGTLDLGHNDFVIQQGQLAQITNQVKQGFNNGNWNGTGITSSTAAADTMRITALGVILNNQGGTALFNASHLFDGATPGPNDILIKYTYYGDANLDGKVDASDYTRIDNGYLTHATGWFNGDFNYDGTIDGSDYTLIDNAFNRQGSILTDQIAFSTAQLAINSPVPEPASLGTLVFITASLRRRRCPRVNAQYVSSVDRGSVCRR